MIITLILSFLVGISVLINIILYRAFRNLKSYTEFLNIELHKNNQQRIRYEWESKSLRRELESHTSILGSLNKELGLISRKPK